jgi:ferredoxin
MMSGDADRWSSIGQGPTGFEPELGGQLRDAEPTDRTGFEPELGGIVRQKGVYVDEATCIGCRHCAHVARNTFYIEPDYGRSRVIAQDGDSEDLLQEAIDTCPVDCIHWVNYVELTELEAERKYQVLKPVGFPVEQQVTFKRPPRKVRKRS